MITWASEIYGEWAAYVNELLPGCTADYKKNSSRIVNKIQELLKTNEIERPEDGWKKITDMLRGSYTCTTSESITQALKRVQTFMKGKILRI